MSSFLQHFFIYISLTVKLVEIRSLKSRANDAGCPQTVSTYKSHHRPPPQQAEPPQDALVVQKKPVNDFKQPERIVQSVSTALCTVCMYCTVCIYICSMLYPSPACEVSSRPVLCSPLM